MAAKQKLVIIGAGSYGRELLWATRDVMAAGAVGWEPAGFLDDRVDESRADLARRGVTLPVLGAVRDWRPADDELFICSIAAPRTKLELCHALRDRGARFANVVHPTAAVAPEVALGTGVFLFRNVIVSVGAAVGDFVQMNCAATFGHDATAEEGCTINSHCDVTGHVMLRRGVFMGSHASVLPSVEIGEFATIGAGSVAIRRVAAGTTIMGVPGRPIPA